MKQKEPDQIKLALAIFAGAILDKDGYCGCPKCGSRNLFHDGKTFDHLSLYCLDCWYAICTDNPYETISVWNRIDRTAFQLEIQFK